MSQTCIGVLLELATGRVISRHAQKRGNMKDEFSLNVADVKVARSMGIELKAVAHLKYKTGKGGLANRALSAADTSSPYGTPPPTYKPTDPGLIDDEDDEDDEDEDNQTIGVVFPDKTTNRSRRKEVK